MSEKDKIILISGRAVPFDEINVDTDKIAPTEEALYVLSWEEAGDVFCILERRNADGQPNMEHVLNDKRYEGARILFTGSNFGCGSSREHATQGTKARYDVVIAPSFAPIFADNSYAIGLPLLQVSQSSLEKLLQSVKDDPQTHFRIDMSQKLIYWKWDGEAQFNIDEASRKGFLNGTWDERERLVGNLSKAASVASRLTYLNDFVDVK